MKRSNLKNFNKLHVALTQLLTGTEVQGVASINQPKTATLPYGFGDLGLNTAHSGEGFVGMAACESNTPQGNAAWNQFRAKLNCIIFFPWGEERELTKKNGDKHFCEGLIQMALRS